MIPLDDPTSLSLLFHLNSEPWLNDEAYRGSPGHPEWKRPQGVLAEVPLPAAAPTALTDLFRRRHSCRSFAVRPMPLSAIAALLGAAYGVTDVSSFDDQTRFLRRSVPSAGGLFPLEVYAVVRRIEDLQDGLYHYDVPGHSLQLTRQGDLFPALEPMFYAYPFIRDANAVVLVASVFRRTQKKYGPRGYRYILLEAGHSGQNICLRAAELGLATLCMGGFVDSQLNGLLGLEPLKEGVVYSIAVGYEP